ncbi:uncharacterized protein LOC118646414 isoform X2 [Monomorium pharaonis]|uniref:uncharacterized protein LOC118646414 isoform X2 n=1 Tax=Monomorium pharaonis TaxID=307658 RepID=UPI0017476694|nr:uncharacterized protein LOC118646414 isoform X2 [Monomorium pharaonis]
MLGVSQPGNAPSSLRHSASFSCLQRGTVGEGHRARTSTLLQQPSLQLSNGHHQYTSGGQAGAAHCSLLQHHQQQSREPFDPVLQDGNDYGFVRIRPRLRSTNATLYHEEEVAAAKNALREQRDAAAFSDRECDSNFRECSLKVKDHRDLSPKGAVKNQNPLRGALILFTSTSSWWKARQREEQLNASGGAVAAAISAPSSERKWSSSGTSGIAASPSNERKWPSSMTSPTNERKWSVGNSLLTSPSNERKWNRSSVSSTTTNQQDRKWRSLGALLRTPAGAGGSSHVSQNSLSHNMSVSMIESDHFRGEESQRGSSCKARYQQPTSYSARVSRVSRDVYRENGEFGQIAVRSKVSRRLYQDSEPVNELDERHVPQHSRHQLDDPEQQQCRGAREGREHCRAAVETTRGTTISSTARSSRAQSFYLLDDFLRPQPQQPSNKCMLNLYMSPSHAVKCGNEHGRSCGEVRQVTCHQANVGSNITPPRRHNSSSDSLEVATSPLPPPVPPPPPHQAAGNARDRERNENPKDASKDVCPCKQCWTNMQRPLVEESPGTLHKDVGGAGTKVSEKTVGGVGTATLTTLSSINNASNTGRNKNNPVSHEVRLIQHSAREIVERDARDPLAY